MVEVGRPVWPRPPDPLRQADSGHDRRPDDADATASGFRSVALQSAFCQLRLKDGGPAAKPLAWLPRPLTGAAELLPDGSPSPAAVEGAWPDLAARLIEHAESLNLRDLEPDLAVQAVTGFSEQFQTLVAASTMDRPDVSLHDHAAVTAAIACAIYRFHSRRGDLDRSAIQDRKALKFRFVVGSLSGIQGFIFDLPAEQRRGIARSYRGGSFYISALTEAVVQRLLRAIGLPTVNFVLNAGGRFVILADSGPVCLEAIREQARQIEQWLVDTHVGLMGLNLAWELTIRGNDMLGGRFAEVYRALERQVEQAKRRPLASWLRSSDGWACNRFLSRHDAHRLRLAMSDQARRFGRALPSAAWFGLYPEKSAPAGLLDPPIDCCGLQLQLGDGQRPPDALSSAILAASMTERGIPGAGWLPRRPLANYVPILSQADVAQLQADRRTEDAPAAGEEPDEGPPVAGRPATFEHLAALSRRPGEDGYVGRPMLAALKADVDRLGLLISRGFGSDISFARVASFSRLLDLFFKGYLTGRLARQTAGSSVAR